ncbi:MAG: DNA cytosine methyltransferase [Desulforegulaceae bacterium]|nr:DNA cytosine methyltransferase [Desulforegulaceae bacterium]
MENFEKSYETKLSQLSFIDLFSGIGGFRLAFESFGAKCVFSSEWDKDCQDIYYENFGEKPYGDITKISESQIPNHDILCAGFPCQAFSISGKQLGFQDTRGTLFFEIARIIKHHLPKLVFLENVKNFENHDKGRTLKVVINILNEAGYDVYYKVLNASLFGIPQKRERIYILAFRKDLKVDGFKFVRSTDKYSKLKDFCLPDELTKKYIITRNDVKLKEDVKIEKDIFGNYPQKPIRIGIVNKGGQGERIYHECGHAVTLSAYGGGIGAKTGLYMINKKIRRLAPLECAKISGFPESFILHDSDSVNYRVFGNTVVINVLQYIIKKIIDDDVFSLF